MFYSFKRFIPSRSLNNWEFSNYLLLKSSNCQDVSKSNERITQNKQLTSLTASSQKRVLNLSNPVSKYLGDSDHYKSEMEKWDLSFSTKSNKRKLPLGPCVILDAPCVVDDYCNYKVFII